MRSAAPEIQAQFWRKTPDQMAELRAKLRAYALQDLNRPGLLALHGTSDWASVKLNPLSSLAEQGGSI